MSNEEIERIIGELDLHRLQRQLAGIGYGPMPVAIGDLFACGCYFIHQGRKTLGDKLCRTALSAYRVDPSLIERILRQVEGKELELATLLNPHLELPGWLFDEDEKGG